MSNKYKLEGESKGISIGGLGRFFSLILVLFIGIFSVYSIENWNSEKQDKLQESKYLDELLEESRVNIELLSEDMPLRQERLTLMRFLLENQNRPVGDDTLRMALRHLMLNEAFLPKEGVTQYLIASGGLKFIGSDQILDKTKGIPRTIQNVIEKRAIDQRLIENKIEPYLIEEGVLSLLEPLSNSEEIRTSQQQIDRIIRVLLNDREFVDLVYLRFSRSKDVIDAQNALSEDLNSLASMIQMELETASNK